LPPVLDRAQQRVQRDDRLPRADVALQQPLHRRRLREVEIDLGDRTLLVLSERERQDVAIPLDQLTRLRERVRDRVRVAGTRNDELQREQLVEREPLSRLLGLRVVDGEVDRRERVAAQRQLELGGQHVRKAPRVLGERRAHKLAQARRGDQLARRVHRREVGGAPRLADVVALDVEAVAAELAAQPHARPRCQLLREPRLVEERRADLPAAVVTDDRGDDRAPPAQRARASACYSTLDRDFALGLGELRDRDLLGGALVAPRCVEEQVAHGLDAEATQALRHRHADAGQRRDVERVESLRRRPAARARPVALDHTCETRVHPGHCRHRDRG
jgi:hypothetical protein